MVIYFRNPLRNVKTDGLESLGKYHPTRPKQSCWVVGGSGFRGQRLVSVGLLDGLCLFEMQCILPIQWQQADSALSQSDSDWLGTRHEWNCAFNFNWAGASTSTGLAHQLQLGWRKM